MPDTIARPTILIVDDEPAQRELLARCLLEWGFDTVQAEEGEEALDVIDDRHVDMVISDVRMPGMTGLELVSAIRETSVALPVLVITAFPDIRQAVDAVKDGALDYLAKPIDLDELRDLVAAALGTRRADDDPIAPTPSDLVCESTQMKHVLREAHLVAASDATILITGESGTGKEVVADLIHSWSDRASSPFVKLNCAAIPENMVESELFGHERGAFTGAAGTRDGRWATADGGTLMLDEIGELPHALQAKLLRALQDGSFSRLGSDSTLHADVRVIAATNRDLEEEVAGGRFREDLFYRVNVVELHVPALRDRPDDITPLARQFAREFTGDESARISPAAERVFLSYPWPGNIRELRNVLERACLMARGAIILPEHLSPRVVQAVRSPQKDGATSQPGGTTQTLAELERQKILETLAQCRGNRTRAAELLGIGRRTLIYKLKSYAKDVSDEE